MKDPIMKNLVWIGRGSAFNVDMDNSSFALYLKTPEKKDLDVIFEMPMTTARRMIRDFKHDANKHDPVQFIIVISHLHEDHVGGLTTFLYWLKYCLHSNIEEDVTIVCPDLDEMETYLSITGFDVDADGNRVRIVNGINRAIKSSYDEEGYLKIVQTPVKHIEGMKCSGFSVYLNDNADELTPNSFFYTGDCCELPEVIREDFNYGRIGYLITEVSDAPSNTQDPVHMSVKYLMEIVTTSDFRRVYFTHVDSDKTLNGLTSLAETVDKWIVSDWAKGEGYDEGWIEKICQGYSLRDNELGNLCINDKNKEE